MARVDPKTWQRTVRSRSGDRLLGEVRIVRHRDNTFTVTTRPRMSKTELKQLKRIVDRAIKARPDSKRRRGE